MCNSERLLSGKELTLRVVNSGKFKFASEYRGSVCTTVVAATLRLLHRLEVNDSNRAKCFCE